MERQPFVFHRWTPLVGLRVLVVLGVILFFTERFTTAQATPDVDVRPGGTRKCWIFAHMNKSGGSSIKKLLKPFIQKQHNVTQGLYDTQQWMSGSQFAETYIETGNTITWGGYTEGLRPYGVQDCKWFTMFRHPISRVVSAYYYCKQTPVDQLCADFGGKTDDDDILGFAKHWGNYGLMQFVLAFVTPEDITSNDTWAAGLGGNPCIDINEESGRETFSTTEPRKCPGWYLLKLFVERRSVDTAPGTDEPACQPAVASLNQVWIHQFLQPAMNLLSEKYTAVGLLEQWDTSIQLFQSALELPKLNWETAFRETGISRVNTDLHDEEHETLAKAWYDPRIRELLWLDILLYDHAVSVFNKQVEENGL